MPENDWIKNLATADFVEGHWALAEPDAARSQIGVRIEESITDLHEEMREAAEVFNVYAGPNRNMRILPLSHHNGFVLLYGHSQIKVEYEPYIMRATLSHMHHYAHRPSKIIHFTPQFDPFGALMWTLKEQVGSLFTSDLIIQKLMEFITRSTFEVENK